MSLSVRYEGIVWTPMDWGFKNEKEYPFPFEFFTSEFGRTLIALCVVRNDWDAIAQALFFSGRDDLHKDCLWLDGEKWTSVSSGKNRIFKHASGQEKTEAQLVREMKKTREKIKASDKRHQANEQQEMYRRKQLPRKTASFRLNIPT